MRRILLLWTRSAHARGVMPPPPRWSRRGQERRGTSREAVPTMRDPVGMVIPEACMRASHVSFASFDRTIESASRDILALHETSEATQARTTVKDAEERRAASPTAAAQAAVRVTHRGSATDTSSFGARFDRRQIRFQGRSRDFGTFAELAARAAADVECDLREYSRPHNEGDSSTNGGSEKEGEVRQRTMRSVTSAVLPSWSARIGSYAFVRDHRDKKEKEEEEGAQRGGHATLRRLLKSAESSSHEKTKTDAASTSSHVQARHSDTRGGALEAAVRACLAPSRRANQNDEHDSDREEVVFNASAASRARRRAARRERDAAREMRQYGLALHPCRLQGGCPHAARDAPCPFLTHPAVCCVTQLRTGSCAAAQRGDCPWHHAPLGESRGETLSAEFLLTASAEEEGGARRARVRAGAARVGRLVQLYVDLVTAQLERSAALRRAFLTLYNATTAQGGAVQTLCALLREAAAQSASEAIQLCFVTRNDGKTEEAEGEAEWLFAVRRDVAACALVDVDSAEVTHDAEDCTRAADMSLLAPPLEPGHLSAATPAATSTGIAEATDAETQRASFYAMWDAEATEGAAVDADTSPIDCRGVMPDTNVRSDVWHDLRHLFSSYVIFCDDGVTSSQTDTVAVTATTCSGGNGSNNVTPLLCLAPRLTRLVLEMSVAQLHNAEACEPHEIFARCAEVVLRHRMRACTGYIRHSPLLQCTLCGGCSQSSANEAGRTDTALDWSPLLLLRDCLLLSQLTSCATLLSSSSFDTNTTTSVTDKCGLLFDLLLRVADETNLSSHSTQDSSRSTFSTVNEAAMTRVAIERAWDVLHTVLLRLCAGLLVCGTPSPNRRRSNSNSNSSNVGRRSALLVQTRVPPAPTPWLLSFVQPALVQLARDGGAAFATRYEAPLRHAIGWQPWSSASLRTDRVGPTRTSAAATATDNTDVLYTATGYARHHMPLLGPSVLNSLLNALMLTTLLHTERLFAPHLSLRSALRQQLMLEEEDGQAERRLMRAQPLLWFSLQRRMRGSARHYAAYVARLRPFVGLSLGFMNELESQGREQQAQYIALQQQYAQQRRDVDEEAKEEVKVSQHTGSDAQRRQGSRKHKAIVQQEAAVPLIDRLLPYGTVVMSAAVTSRLVRQLFASGKAYKALRLGAGIVHLVRMLRHAVKLPAPHLERGSKLVHKHVWSQRKQRKVHVRQRVATLRLVDPASEAIAASRPQQPLSGLSEEARHDVRPIAMAYEVREEVMSAIVQVGLAHGESGRALVDGVVQDSLTRALVDYTAGRTLPCAITPALLQHYFSDPDEKTSQCSNNSSAANDVHMKAHSTLKGSQSMSHASLVQGTRDIVPSIAALVQSRITTSPSSSALYAEGVTSTVQAYYVAPTAQCLELLLASTAHGDRAQRAKYEAVMKSDLTRFATPWVMLVWQGSRMADKKSRVRALRALQRVWHELLCSSDALSTVMSPVAKRPPASTLPASWHETCDLSLVWKTLSQEARVRAAHTGSDDTDETIGEMSYTAMRRQAMSSVAHVKAYLQGQSMPEDSKTNATNAPRPHTVPHITDAQFMLHCWSRAVQPDARHQRQLLWAITVATLLHLDEDVFTHVSQTTEMCNSRTQSLSDFAAQLLHLAFLLAISLQDFNYIDATVKVLVLSPLMRDDTGKTSATGSTRTQQNNLYSKDMSQSCNVSVFIELQQCAAHALVTDQTRQHMDDSSVQTLKAFTARYAERSYDAAKCSPVWTLYVTLLQQPVVAELWMYHTYTNPSQPLLMWLVAQAQRDAASRDNMLVQWASQVASTMDDKTITQLVQCAFGNP